MDVTRATASATYHSAFRDNGIWATTIGWGRNSEPGHASNALLLESSLSFSDRDAWYGRFEAVAARRRANHSVSGSSAKGAAAD